MVEAETEYGERLARCWRHEGALSPATFAERVRWQLDGWLTQAQPAARPVEGDTRAEQDLAAFAEAGLDSTTGALTLVRLVPDEVVPAHGRQLGFWGGDQVAHDRADRALARVQGMLGYDAVATAVVQGGRTPAEQVRWVPWGEPRASEHPDAGAETPGWPGAVPAPYPRACLRRRRSPPRSSTTAVAPSSSPAAAITPPHRHASSATCSRAVVARCSRGPVRGPTTCAGGTHPRAVAVSSGTS